MTRNQGGEQKSTSSGERRQMPEGRERHKLEQSSLGSYGCPRIQQARNKNRELQQPSYHGDGFQLKERPNEGEKKREGQENNER